jgi:HPt (histidine-containing phosphotransfer) domain-containing protein
MDPDDADAANGATVDWDAARSLTAGDDALLAELVELFPSESSKHLEAIKTALAEEDDASLTRAAHTLKSSARLFGATSLVASASEMETLGQSSELGAARERLPKLEAEIGRVVEALQRGPGDQAR